VREELTLLREERARVEGRVRSLDEDVELALASGKDDLARFAIRRLVGERRTSGALAAEIAEREGEREALDERVGRQQAQLDALRARVRAELARGAEPSAGESSGWGPGYDVADEEVEIELLRRRRAGREEG